MKYTSQKLSKRLQAGGCELESEIWWSFEEDKWILTNERREDFVIKQIPAYDYLWDICIKFPEVFFGKPYIKNGHKSYFHPEWEYPLEIIKMLQQNKTQDEIEEFFWSVCKFNEKNK